MNVCFPDVSHLLTLDSSKMVPGCRAWKYKISSREDAFEQLILFLKLCVWHQLPSHRHYQGLRTRGWRNARTQQISFVPVVRLWFFLWSCMDVRIGLWRRLSTEELMLLNCGVGEDSWEFLTLQGDPTSPFWRRSALGFLWKEWCYSWNSNTLATSCEELTHWKRLWCWEGLGAGGKEDDRGWDGWMASLTWWMWVWVNSRSWWWTGRPGMLRFMGSRRVGHDWVTELNWKILLLYHSYFPLVSIWMNEQALRAKSTVKCRATALSKRCPHHSPSELYAVCSMTRGDEACRWMYSC